MREDKRIQLACEMAALIVTYTCTGSFDHEELLLDHDGAWLPDIQPLFDCWYDRICELLEVV